MPVDMRLYLPQCWIDDPARCDRAEILMQARTMRSKTDLALEMVRAARGCALRGSASMPAMARRPLSCAR
jgi:SRSO17 transposase